ncbi:hypothetical protein [Gymnodinialimonas sp. 57CJ19]|uniref:hypothetical protein n=1 Tax=Gymnodinialimonas sp. 57CJ19 TaxID=3138498 RepID=UPI00313454CC
MDCYEGCNIQFSFLLTPPKYPALFAKMKLGHVLAFYGILSATLFGIGSITEVELPNSVTMCGASLLLAAVLVALALDDSSRRERIIETLSVPRFTPLYDRYAEGLVAWGTRVFSTAPPNPDDRSDARILADCLNYRLLDRALLFAVVYPILLLVLFWATTGRAAYLGTVEVVQAADAPIERLATIGGLFAIFASVMIARRLSTAPQRFVRSVAGLLPVLATLGVYFGLIAVGAPVLVAVVVAGAVVVVVAGAFAVAGAVAVAFTVAFAVVVAFAGAGAFTVAFAVVVAFAGAFAVAFAVAVERCFDRGQDFQAGAIALSGPACMLLFAAFFISWDGVTPERGAYFLFLGVLPLINGVFDAVSYGATLALLQLGRRHHRFLSGLVDFVLAILLFLGLGVALTFMVAWLNRTTGFQFVDLGHLLANAADLGTYWWLYAMLFSTALPTLLHLVAVVLSWQSVIGLPLRKRLAAQVTRAGAGDPLAGVVASLGLAFGLVAAVAIPIGGLALVGYGLWGWALGPFLGAYRETLLSIANMSGGL